MDRCVHPATSVARTGAVLVNPRPLVYCRSSLDPVWGLLLRLQPRSSLWCALSDAVVLVGLLEGRRNLVGITTLDLVAVQHVDGLAVLK